MHRQRHFPEEEVLAAMERAGLECLDVFGHGFDAVLKQPLDDLVHTKAVYLARPRGIDQAREPRDERSSGSDGTRTRDLRRDRPAL